MLAACAQQADSIESSLKNIQSILAAENADNKVLYQLSFDTDFPCNTELQENWKGTDSDWQHTYRFDLTNIETNTFVQSKSGRRAIVYGGYKTTAEGIKKVFSEKRINNIRYRATLSDKDQRQLLSAMNTAITLCEEKYSFE